MDISHVTRFEVINHTSRGQVSTGTGPGRVLVSYGVTISLSLQDDGRTLKVFLTDPGDSIAASVVDISEGGHVVKTSGRYGVTTSPGAVERPVLA